MAIIECVPNFSEGKDAKVVARVTTAIGSSPGVHILHVDSGISANRTVITFAGEPEAVVEGAYRGIQEAAALIDMNRHKGTHPRIGATDVCPLIPISGIAMEEVVRHARVLGKRIAEKLGIPVYLYEQAAALPERVNLANIRKGGFEHLVSKLKEEAWKPDFGIPPFHKTAGATVIGVRDFLLAYNVNLNTNKVEVAKDIAADIRTSGKPEFRPATSTARRRIALPDTRAIGWYLEENDIAQVSMNLTNLNITPMHVAFEAVKKAAEVRGYRVTGSELIGLIPLQVLLEAGKYFRCQKGMPASDCDDNSFIAEAIESLGLANLKPFDPQEKILEYNLYKNGFSL